MNKIEEINDRVTKPYIQEIIDVFEDFENKMLYHTTGNCYCEEPHTPLQIATIHKNINAYRDMINQYIDMLSFKM